MRFWILLSIIFFPIFALGNEDYVPIILPEEKKQGEELLQLLSKECTFLNDFAVEEYVTNLIGRLSKNTKLANYHGIYLIIKDNTLNAFAGPAGIIGINTGTFQICQHEGELAAILAHEIAHITQNHLQQLANRARADTFTTALGLILGSILTTIDPELALGATYSSLGSIAYQQLSYSRIHEKEADQIGLKILFSASFDPIWMPKAFEKFQTASLIYKETYPKWLSTHPLNAERISYTYNQALNYPPKRYKKDFTYNLIRARLAYLQNSPIHNNSEEENLIEKTYYNLLKNLNNPSKNFLTQLKLLKKFFPKHYLISLLEAEYYFRTQQIDTALSILGKAYQIDPLNLAIILKYTEFLNHAKQLEKSQEILRSTYLRTNRLELLENLAKVYNLKGQKINSYLTQITIYEKKHQKKKALILVNHLLQKQINLQPEQLSKLKIKQQELKKELQQNKL